MTLYIDLGNTNIKVGYLQNNEWNFHIHSLNQNNYIAELKEIIKAHDFNRVWISSTNPKKESYILATLKDLEVRFIQKGVKTKLKLQLHNIKEVGSDIIANAMYASSIKDNVILFSFGTALVVSHIKNKTLEGASIFPGIQASLNALSKDATMIGDIKIVDEGKILGRDTIEAVSSGFLNSYKYIIEGFVREIDPNAYVIITGGGAHLVKDLTSYPVVEETVLRGLYEISKIN